MSPRATRSRIPKANRSDDDAKSTLQYLMSSAKPRLSTLLESVHTPNTCFIQLHGVWYDMSSFLSRHPGGATALRLGAGRDATALFESSHVFAERTKIDGILSKCRLNEHEVERLQLSTLESGLLSVDPAEFPGEYGTNLDWEFSGRFRSDVVERVRNYFECEAQRRGVSLIESTKATPAKWGLILISGVIFLITIYFLVAGYWSMILLCPLAGWICGVNCFHDALHFALSTNPCVNSVVGACFPFFSSPFAWYHQHVIGHHVHTNMPYRDPDLVHGTEIRREHVDHPLHSLHLAQATIPRIMWHFLVGTWLGLGGINDMKLVFSPTKSYNGFIPRIPVKPDFLVFHVITRTFYYLLQFGWPFLVFDSSTAFSKRMAFSFGPAMVFSFLFMLNTQVNHLSPSAMDPHRAKTRDWTVHQVITAQNFGDPEGDGVAWWFHFILSGGLNLQMEHHLFPTVNHCHLRAVSVILKDECRRHGIPYNQVSGYIEAMCEYVKHSKNAVSLDGLSETKDTNLSQ